MHAWKGRQCRQFTVNHPLMRCAPSADLAGVALPLVRTLRNAIAEEVLNNEACDLYRRICSLSYIRKYSIDKLHVAHAQRLKSLDVILDVQGIL